MWFAPCPNWNCAQAKFLSPTVHFRFGRKHVEKALADFARGLGIKPRVNAQAVMAAYAAQRRLCRRACRKRARRRWPVCAETGEPALVLVGRPYNIFDRSVNCDIPRKLRTLYGINVLPMEVLPLDEEDISDVNPNMYWNSGRRILAAARIVRRHPNLHLVYISNFKCGPDSYIKSFVDEAAGKPSLVLQFDGHANDAGLHYALRSVSGQQRILAMSLFPHRHSSRKIGPDHPLSGKVVYVPTMGEGSPEAFAAAFRWLGVEAQPTPPSDERTRELGGKYTTRRRMLSRQGHGGRFSARHRAARLRRGAHGFLHAHGGRPLPLRAVRAVPAQDSARRGIRKTCRCSPPPAATVTATWVTSPTLLCARRGGRWCAPTPSTARC